MNGHIHVDRDALRRFVETMRRTADDMAAVRDRATPAFTGNYLDIDTAKWNSGVKVTLGVVNHEHPGRDAGEVMSNRIVTNVNFVVSMEEGTRAMGGIAEAILRSLDNQDNIAAADLETILAEAPAPAQDTPDTGQEA